MNPLNGTKQTALANEDAQMNILIIVNWKYTQIQMRKKIVIK